MEPLDGKQFKRDRIMPLISKPILFLFLAAIIGIGVEIILLVRNEAAATRAEIAKIAEETPKKAIKSLGDSAVDTVFDLGKTIFGMEKHKEDLGIEGKPEKKGNIFSDVIDTINNTARTVDDKIQDFMGISPGDEKKVGKQIHEYLASQVQLNQKNEDLVRVKRLAEPLLKLRSRKEIDYTFFIVQSAEINAFATPGGFIYINQGLLKFMETDSELQFVIGHEIAHVDLKHPTKSLAYVLTAEKMAGKEGGEIAYLAYTAISAGYKKEDEFAADLQSLAWLKTLGFSRKNALAGARKLVALTHQLEGKDFPGKPKGGPKILEMIDRHFATHPNSEERLSRLESAKWQ